MLAEVDRRGVDLVIEQNAGDVIGTFALDGHCLLYTSVFRQENLLPDKALFFRVVMLYPVVNVVEAVSYTHLDVYKRQVLQLPPS